MDMWDLYLFQLLRDDYLVLRGETSSAVLLGVGRMKPALEAQLVPELLYPKPGFRVQTVRFQRTLEVFRNVLLQPCPDLLAKLLLLGCV